MLPTRDGPLLSRASAIWRDAGPVAVLALAMMLAESLPRLIAVPELWSLWQRVAMVSTAVGAVWIGLVPLLWYVTGWLRTRRRRAEQVLLGIAVVLFATLMEALWSRELYQATQRNFVDWWISRGDRTMYTVIVVMAARLARDLVTTIRNAQARIIGQRAALRHAELHRLDRQLQPHFLFNALNTIAEFVHHNTREASQLIDNLLRLFDDMETRTTHFRTLADEIAALAPYLGIQRARFGARLDVVIDVSNDAARAAVPSLMLQPLVENAIRHGVERLPSGGTVTITGRVEGSTLAVDVRNPALPSEGMPTVSAGIGTRNVRERLESLYGDEASLQLSLSGHEAVVTARMPVGSALHPTPAAEIDHSSASEEASYLAALARLARFDNRTFAAGVAGAAWLLILSLWLAWGALAAWQMGVPYGQAIGGPLAVVRELGLFVGATLVAIVLLSTRLVDDTPIARSVLVQFAVAMGVAGVLAWGIAHSGDTRTAKLAAAGHLGKRMMAFAAIGLAVNVWRWQVRQLRLDRAWHEGALRAAELHHAERAHRFDRSLVRQALVAIGVQASIEPGHADDIVVALSRVLRSALLPPGASPHPGPTEADFQVLRHALAHSSPPTNALA